MRGIILSIGKPHERQLVKIMGQSLGSFEELKQWAHLDIRVDEVAIIGSDTMDHVEVLQMGPRSEETKGCRAEDAIRLSYGLHKRELRQTAKHGCYVQAGVHSQAILVLSDLAETLHIDLEQVEEEEEVTGFKKEEEEEVTA